jgi:hypothetical protein
MALSLVAVTEIYAQPSARNYFVDAGKGKDTNNGTSINRPFKTISKARQVVQSLDKTRGGDIFINLLGGIYFQDTTLEFNEKDGGTNNCNIIYKNFDGKVPVISGGQRIAGWKIFDKAKNIYRANAESLTFRQLYINGGWGIRARTPDKTKNSDIKWDATNKEIRIGKKNIAQWQNFDKTEMVTINPWSCHHLRLESFTSDSLYAHITTKKEEQFVFQLTSYFHGKEYFFENAYEFLDIEGEWYLNTADHYVYYKPRIGEDMSNVEIIAPKLVNIVRVEGKSINSTVSNLQFRGISFMHSTWLVPDTVGYIEMQATQYWMSDTSSGISKTTGRPSAGVIVKNAHHVFFERCLFANMGATALEFSSGTHHDVVIGNIFRDIAGNALSMGLLTAKVAPYKPADENELPSNELISNNYITRVGKDNVGAVGIFYAYARDVKIEHNEIENVPYTGISGGWGWDPKETPMCNNTISNNYIHDYMKVLYDGAGIYTLSSQPNSFCSDNYIENMKTGSRGYGWCALYADEGTRHLTIKNNVCEIQQDKIIYWLSLQTVGQGAKECPVVNNFTNSSTFGANGQPVTNIQYYPKADWPVEAKKIINNSGLGAAYKNIKDNLNSN